MEEITKKPILKIEQGQEETLIPYHMEGEIDVITHNFYKSYRARLRTQKMESWKNYRELSKMTSEPRDIIMADWEKKRQKFLDRGNTVIKNGKTFLKFTPGSEDQKEYETLKTFYQEKLDYLRKLDALAHKQYENNRQLENLLQEIEQKEKEGWSLLPENRQSDVTAQIKKVQIDDFHKTVEIYKKEQEGIKPEELPIPVAEVLTTEKEPVISKEQEQKEQQKQEELNHLINQTRGIFREISDSSQRLARVLYDRIDNRTKSLFTEDESYTLINLFKYLDGIDFEREPDEMTQKLRQVARLFSEVASSRIPEQVKDDYDSLNQVIKTLENIQHGLEVLRPRLRNILDLKEESKDKNADVYNDLIMSTRIVLDATEEVKTKVKRIMNQLP